MIRNIGDETVQLLKDTCSELVANIAIFSVYRYQVYKNT